MRRAQSSSSFDQSWQGLGLASLTLIVLAGCAAPPGAIAGTRPQHVLILPGIGGDSREFRDLCRDINDDAYLAIDAEVWDWTRLEPPFTLFGGANIVNAQRNARRADRLAAEIIAWQRRHPDNRLTLVGHSGGGGMALMACERLPSDGSVRLDRIVLISPAVCPHYDLRDALSKSRGGVFHYFSTKDRFILDLGTRVFGTMERCHTVAAGCVGFAAKDGRLEHLPWTPSMKRWGNRGGHLGALQRPFVRRFILPELRDDRPIHSGHFPVFPCP